MDTKVIEEKIDSLLDAVKNSREYEEYKKQEELLDQDPDLKARVFNSAVIIFGCRMKPEGMIYSRWQNSCQGSPKSFAGIRR